MINLEKFIIYNKETCECVATNYMPLSITKHMFQPYHHTTHKKIQYINRTKEELHSRHQYISLDSTKQYNTLVIEECPDLFAMIGILICYDDIVRQLKISIKYDIDIEQQVLQYITNIYNKITPLWKRVLDQSGFEIVERSYNKLVLHTIPVINELLIDDIFIQLYKKKYLKCMELLYGCIAIHPYMKQYIFRKKVQYIFLQENINLPLLFKYSNVAINLMYTDDRYTMYTLDDRFAMMKMYNSIHVDPFVDRVMPHRHSITSITHIDMKQFSKQMSILTNDILDWNIFIITGKCIRQVLSNDIDNIDNIEVTCRNKDISFDDLIELVKKNIVDVIHTVEYYISDQVPYRIVLNKNIHVYLNTYSNSYYDGKYIHGDPSFWCDVFSKSSTVSDTSLLEYYESIE